MKNSTIYIVAAIVVVAIVAYFLFRKNGNTAAANGVGSDVGQTFPGGGIGISNTNSTLPYVGETFASWYARRKQDGFRFNTNLI